MQRVKVFNGSYQELSEIYIEGYNKLEHEYEAAKRVSPEKRRLIVNNRGTASAVKGANQDAYDKIVSFSYT